VCKNCEIPIPIAIESKFDGIGDIIEKVFNGVLKRGDVVKSLWLSTAATLFDGVEKGYGQKLIGLDFETPDAQMLMQLRENVYVFSAFKTYQELRHMSDLLIGEDGKLRSKAEFRKEALNVHADYDIRFLNAEYDHATAGSQMAATWQRAWADRDALPFLKYITAGDERVRKAHAVLNGITLPIEDKFWDIYFPPNGWGCRCDEESLDRGRITDTSKIELPEIQPMFRNNIGKTGVLFPDSHPYFQVAAKDKAKAKNLFGLKIPKP
jgi:SPP1 gp7 family putative phage head morphogenesis protein